MLQIKNITYRVGDRTLFENANARIPEGTRIGLVGSNGSGKTTLLRLVTKENELDGGSIDFRAKCKLGTVAQEAPEGSHSPIQEVLKADWERHALLDESESATDPLRIAEIHTRLADIEAHSAPARAAIILAGLGFTQEAQNKAISSFSGGWKMRIALASALFSEPDLLLLDEPTNHLDLESIMWLEAYLRQYPHTLVVVSHDRDLLNHVVDNILLVENDKLTMYSGGYDTFIKTRSMQVALQAATVAKQEATKKHLQSFIDRFKAKASKAKQAQSRVKALERMAPIQALAGGRHITFNFPGPLTKPSPLIKLDDAEVGYQPGRPILSNLHLSVFSEDRIALLGANGNGKTTLARLLANELPVTTGYLVPATNLKVGYFAQDHLERLNTNLTALEQVRAEMPGDSPDKVRGWLGRFGFEQSRAEVLVDNLSGGEKTRLALALLALERPNLMILDEPTNHLDVDARTALIEGLNSFEGTIVLISHDRNLIEATCDQLWLVEDGTCKQYFGDMEDYRKFLLSNRQSLLKKEKANSNGGVESDKVNKKTSRQKLAQQRKLIAPLKKIAKVAEENLENLTSEKEKIDIELSDPLIYATLPEKVASLTKRQRNVETLIETAEEAWIETQSDLEEAIALMED